MPTGPGYICEFRDDSGMLVDELGADDIVDPSIPQEHSVISEWEFRTPYNPSLEAVRHSSALIYFEDSTGSRELMVRGPVDEIKSDDQRGETLVRGRDQIAKLLEEGPDNGVVVADGPADEEIQAVWDQTEFEADVFGSEADVLSEDLKIQDGPSSFGSNISSTDPVVVSGFEVRPAQIGWTLDAVDAYFGDPFVETNDDWTGGEAVEFDGGIDEEFVLEFNLDYTIPADNLRLALRRDGRESDENPGYEFFFDGEFVEARPEGTGLNNLSWATPFVDKEVAPGSHTMTIVGDGDSGDGDWYVDRVAVFDERWTTTDNEVHEPGGHLDAPHRYPTDTQEIRAESAGVEDGSISEATITTSINDVSGDQRLLLFVEPESFGFDFVSSNSETLGPVDTPLTTTLQAAVELAATDEIRNDDTPRKAFEPQTLSSYEMTVTTVDKIVFEDEEFDGNYFDILQAMHSDAGLIFRGIVDEDSLRAETFERGAFVENIDWTRLGFTRGFNTADFANKVVAVGGEDDNGSRPTAEQSDEESINDIGERPVFVVNEQITTPNGIENFAKAELNQRLTKDNFAGEIEIVPRRLKPGYRYPVEAFDGEESVLERVVFQDGRNPSGELIFEDLVDVSRAISGVRQEARRGRR